jgi:hypothetical protein
MTAHALLQAARRHNAPACVARYLEDRAIAETLQALQGPPPPSRWPWIILALAAAFLAGAAVVPHAEPIAQVVDAGGEE